MILNININTADPLDERDRVILLALAGEISLSEASEPRERPERTLEQAREEAKPTLDAIAEVEEALNEAVEEAVEAHAEPETEEPKAKKPVNVSDASLEKYDFHRTSEGEIVCDHCEYVSETGRALHLHAGTHKDEAAPKEKALRSVPTPKEPEAGVDAFLGTSEDEPKITEAEKATAVANDYTEPEPEPAEVPEPPKAVNPKVLRDTVAKVATEMVAAGRQSEIRSVLDDVLGGVPRVSMIDEKDLQKFLDAEPIAAFVAEQKAN